MNLSDISKVFNRALSLTFSKRKLLLTFIILALCGLLVVFCRAVAVHAGSWIVMSLTFLPIFLSSGVLLSLGIILIRLYHDEIKKRGSSLSQVFEKSWETIIGASYFSIPIILSYLTLWMMLGLFFLLQSIPGIGDFFSVLLAFGPFLLNFGALLLCVLSISMLFFLTPAMALRGFDRKTIVQSIMYRIKNDLFSSIFLGLLAIFPALFILMLLIIAAQLTDSAYVLPYSSLYISLQWFFIMIPFAAILTPAVIFFFNFAAEAHVLAMKAEKTPQ
jgi:hypothetical protein